jgi:hypothetical protein
MGNSPSAKKAKAVTMIQFAFRVTSIHWTLLIFDRESNNLLNASAIFETDTRVLAPSEWPWSAEAQRKDSIEFQFPIQERFPKIVLCRRSVKVSGSTRIFDSATDILTKTFAIFEKLYFDHTKPFVRCFHEHLRLARDSSQSSLPNYHRLDSLLS